MNIERATINKTFDWICFGFLAMSVIHAGNLAVHHVDGLLLKASVVIGIGLALFTSQMLVESISALSKAPKGFIWLLAFVIVFPVIGAIEKYSISTSTTTVDSGFLASQRKTNHESPEYKQHAKKIARLENDLVEAKNQRKTLEHERNSMDQDRYKGKGNVEVRIDKSKKEIKSIERQIDAETKSMNNVDVSISSMAFKNLEAKTGEGQTDIIFMFALLCSICPLTLRFVKGVINTDPAPAANNNVINIDADRKPGKKPNKQQEKQYG